MAATQDPVPCPHPGCGKAFKSGAAMRKHTQTHAPKGQIQCPHCPHKLKTKDSLRKHFNTRHNTAHEHPHQCPVCGKRFQNRGKMVKHHLAHNADDEEAQRAAAKVVGAEVTRLIADAIAGTSRPRVAGAGQADAGRHSVACAQCKGRAPRDDPALFTCSECSKAQHWKCGGLHSPPDRALPSPVCVACLGGSGKRATALAEAALGRSTAEAYCKQRGLRIEAADPDGWCLLRCVAGATGLGDPAELLGPAATAVLERVDLSALDEATRATVRTEAQQIVNRPDAAARRIGGQWNTVLWDHLPSALSAAVNRPLHIVSGNVGEGRVTQTVVDLTTGGAEPPIVLVRSAFEYGLDHYDLAVPVQLA